MSFCIQCGHKAQYITPKGDHRPRLVCPACEHIHYDNPRLIVGTLATWQGKILLAKRAIEPRKDFWTLPAGFMENKEDTQTGAVRETFEETGAEVTNLSPLTLCNLAEFSQIHLFYLAEMTSETFHTTDESSEVGLFSIDEALSLPIAFRSVELTLQHYKEHLGNNPPFVEHNILFFADNSAGEV